ncbi:MAG: sodium-translocating pyrophosphatase [Candidatus Methanomethylicia archaeon]
MYLIYGSIALGLLAMIIVIYLTLNVIRENVDNIDMINIANYIKEAANAFIKRHYSAIFASILIITVLLMVFNVKLVLPFVIGASSSILAAYIGLRIAVEANVRTAYLAIKSPIKAFKLAFSGGSVVGLSIVSLSLISVGILYLILQDVNCLVGFGFGASLSALFTQLGGGIFTKAADISADLVGKVELGIPEDDPRNPAVIADQVGDIVGDCAGRGSDLFESISDDYVTALILCSFIANKFGVNALAFPILLGASGVLSSLIGIFFVRSYSGGSLNKVFNFGLIISSIFYIISSFVVPMLTFNDMSFAYEISLSIMSGLIVSLIVCFIVQYYTGFGSMPVRSVAESSKRGAALNILTGLSYALQSPFIPVIMVSSAFILSYIITNGSIYGILGANLGTDLAVGFIMSSDAFGPICDNAAGIAEMSGTKVFNGGLDELDALGNTMKAYTKAFASASGMFSTLVIFMTYSEIVGFWNIDSKLLSPIFVVGLLIGASLPFLFSSLTVGATSKTALELVDIIRKQFKENPDIIKGIAKPDYAKCVDVAMKLSLKRMMLPGIITILSPIIIGLVLGKYALGAMLLGGLSTSALLSPMFTFGGGLWDNSKKYIEKDFWMKGTPTHEAAVVGDTVGDPLKDVAGPSLNVFMKLINMIALILASIFSS